MFRSQPYIAILVVFVLFAPLAAAATLEFDLQPAAPSLAEVGTLEIGLTEPDLVTVVIRLKSAGSGAERTAPGSGYVLADAIKLVPVEAPE